MKDINIEQFLKDFHNRYPIDNVLLLEEFDESSIVQVINQLDDEDVGTLLKNSNDNLCSMILEYKEMNQLIQILHTMKPDDIVDTMGLMKVNIRKAVLEEFKNSEFYSIKDLLGYKEDSAGGIMTTEYITLSQELTIEEAYFKVCKIAPKSEVIEELYIVNNISKLIGKINIRDILVLERTRKLSEIMNQKVITVSPEDDQEKVAKLVSKYDLVAIPVVNEEQVVLGVITLDDIIDVIYEEQAEDILNMGSVSKPKVLKEKLFPSILQRMPWLVVNLGTVFFAAFIISTFETEIEKVVALAMAMPVIAGMGGNSGNQVLAMTIRKLTFYSSAVNDKMGKMLLRESIIGLINGIVLGGAAGLIIYLKYENIILSIVVAIAMICNFIVANLSGLLIPSVLNKFKLDPAVGSSVLVTAITDSFGFFILLSLARLILLKF